MKKLYYIFILIVAVALPVSYTLADLSSPLSLQIISSTELNGTAGDFVNVQAQINNTSGKPLENITTYLSLSDNDTKLPVDLEDWSAEKGLFIGSIDTDQAFPLNWKIHFVKAGSYSLTVIAITGGQLQPQISTITHFTVLPKKNLNPANVLPVALGTPIVVIALMFIVASRRKVDE
jgi:hypothetical protein